jgi:hypothetical protein
VIQTSIEEIYQMDLSDAFLIGELNQVPTVEALIATLPKKEQAISLTHRIYGIQKSPQSFEKQWTWINIEFRLLLK